MSISEIELKALIASGESQSFEMKESMGDADAIRKTICAFANDLHNTNFPGILAIGLKDDGARAGLAVTDDLLRKLSDIRGDGLIIPFPEMSVEKHALKGGEIAVVTVQPSPAPPIRYRGQIWVRIGPSTRLASAAEEARLVERRRATDLPFDISPVPRARIEDLDLVWFEQEYLPAAVAMEDLARNQRGLPQRLASLRFATARPPEIPTVTGILAAGIEPREFLPGAYIQFTRFDGTVLDAAVKDQKEISGKISDVLTTMDSVFKAHISVSAQISGVSTEIRRPDYPIVALQQIVRNAILHRSYDHTNAPVRVYWFRDRIEVSSTGGPYGQVTPENFGRPGITDYRNPHIAEVLKNLGFVQRFGLGISLARQELEKNGNPPPDFTVDASNVLVALRSAE